MQWTNDRNYQHETQTDVYADISTPYSATYFSSQREAEQTQEFSLEEIQRKLGVFTPEQTDENTAVKNDTAPSNQTLNMSYDRDYTDSNTASKSRVSTKTKVAISCYTVLILALVIAVSLCGVAVSSTFGAVSASYATYVEAEANVAELTAQASTEDRDALEERAAELGYIAASRSNSQTYTEIETRPAQNFNIESNWFDALCDWLSGAFGG